MTLDQQRERLRELRDLPQPRSPILEAELCALAEELQIAEVEKLSEATHRMRRERGTIEARNRSLERLKERRLALIERLEGTLAEARRERQVIDGELASVLSGVSGSMGE